jgi:hypothetical protein
MVNSRITTSNRFLTLLSAKTLKEDRRAKLLGGLHLGGRKHGVFATPRTALEGDWSVTTISELRRPAANAVVLSRDRP